MGAVGQHYIDTETNYVYICTKILPDGQYVWVQVNGGSSGGSVDEAIADHNKDPNAHSTIIAAAVSEEVAKMAFITEQVNPNVSRADKFMMDKHYLRKHGKNAYYGQGSHK